MQRLHTHDLTAHLLKQEGWELISLPAIAEGDEVLPRLFGQRTLRSKGEALQLQLESREQLRAAMLRMGAKAFMAQYQQRRYPIGEGEGKRGYYSGFRNGVRWKPTTDVEDTFAGFTHVTEEQILLHTLFGEGEHPDSKICASPWTTRRQKTQWHFFENYIKSLRKNVHCLSTQA